MSVLQQTPTDVWAAYKSPQPVINPQEAPQRALASPAPKRLQTRSVRCRPRPIPRTATATPAWVWPEIVSCIGGPSTAPTPSISFFAHCRSKSPSPHTSAGRAGQKDESDPGAEIRGAGRPLPDRAPVKEPVPHSLGALANFIRTHGGVRREHLGAHLGRNQPITRDRHIADHSRILALLFLPAAKIHCPRKWRHHHKLGKCHPRLERHLIVFGFVGEQGPVRTRSLLAALAS